MSSRLSQLLGMSISITSISYISSKGGMITSSIHSRVPKDAASLTVEEAEVRKRKQERILEYLAYPVSIVHPKMCLEGTE